MAERENGHGFTVIPPHDRRGAYESLLKQHHDPYRRDILLVGIK